VACRLTARSPESARWTSAFRARAASAVAQTAGTGWIGPRIRRILAWRRRLFAQRTALPCRFRTVWAWIAARKAFGERIVARDPDRQTAEIQIRIALRNRFSVLGTAEIVRVA